MSSWGVWGLHTAADEYSYSAPLDWGDGPHFLGKNDFAHARRAGPRLAMAWDEFSSQITPATAAGGPVQAGESCENCPPPNYPNGFKYVQRPGSKDRWNYSGGAQMRYRIKHPDNSESYLAYGHYLDNDSKPYLGINMISTDPNHQHQGVAESLIRKLHEDHPGVPIDPGGMTDAGKGFKTRLEERIPEARDVLRRRARLAEDL